VIDAPQSLIIQQVRAGIVVRMAVLVEVLTGSHAADPTVQRMTAPEPQLA